MTPWFNHPAALRTIAGLKQNPPQHSRNTSDNPLQTNAGYSGLLVSQLRDLFSAAFMKVSPRQYGKLLDTSADEVLAALFGCPDGLDWAHTDRAARRVALAAEIDAALALRVAP